MALKDGDPLKDGDRVCYQHWDVLVGVWANPDEPDRADRGTVIDEGERWLVVHWDSGEADVVTEHGWCIEYGFRVVPLGEVPDVVPSQEFVARVWNDACNQAHL